MAKKVFIAMSGGVDSSAAASLLLSQGYDCTGITALLAKDSIQAAKGASEICKKLGIEHITLDLQKEFENSVVEDFVKTYENAKTPNPCVVCNKKIKFGLLYRYALDNGADYYATGHYAITENGRLYKATYSEKDQSYVLYTLTKDILLHTLFPLGKLKKSESRSEAEKSKLVVQSESQDICFVEDGDYASYIAAKTGRSFEHGSFVDTNGNVLGEHKGLINYTIGQRKGLGLSLPAPLYVMEKRLADNKVILCSNEELQKYSLEVENMTFISGEIPQAPFDCTVRVRYAHKGQEAKVTPITDNTARVDFYSPVRAVTPGQSAVFCTDDLVLGGGVIK